MQDLKELTARWTEAGGLVGSQLLASELNQCSLLAQIMPTGLSQCTYSVNSSWVGLSVWGCWCVHVVVIVYTILVYKCVVLLGVYVHGKNTILMVLFVEMYVNVVFIKFAVSLKERLNSSVSLSDVREKRLVRNR